MVQQQQNEITQQYYPGAPPDPSAPQPKPVKVKGSGGSVAVKAFMMFCFIFGSILVLISII